MPIVTIQLSAGRSDTQKDNVARAITDAMVQEFEIAPGTVTIFFDEYQDSQWAKSGRLKSTES